jgi:hypothetical protein
MDATFWSARAGAALLALVSLAHAELPVARLDTVFPLGAKQGTEVEVAITGADLEEGKALHFSHPGITAAWKADKRFVVKVAPEVPPGVYDVRISGLSGVSNPRAFTVSDTPEVARTKPHASLETAVALEPGATFSGTATAAVDDFFTFKARAGQRLLISCESKDIDSKLSPVLSVSGANGETLASSSRSGLVDFTAPAEGAYTLRLHDLGYGGGADYGYRLTLGAGPWIDFVMPPMGTPGAKGKFTIYGRSLPGGTPG